MMSQVSKFDESRLQHPQFDLFCFSIRSIHSISSLYSIRSLHSIRSISSIYSIRSLHSISFVYLHPARIKLSLYQFKATQRTLLNLYLFPHFFVHLSKVPTWQCKTNAKTGRKKQLHPSSIAETSPTSDYNEHFQLKQITFNHFFSPMSKRNARRLVASHILYLFRLKNRDLGKELPSVRGNLPDHTRPTQPDLPDRTRPTQPGLPDYTRPPDQSNLHPLQRFPEDANTTKTACKSAVLPISYLHLFTYMLLYP